MEPMQPIIPEEWSSGFNKPTPEQLAHAAKTRKQRDRYDAWAVWFASKMSEAESDAEREFYDGMRRTFCNLELDMFIRGTC